MVEKKEISSVTISRKTIRPDGMCIHDSLVEVKNHNIKICEKIARDIMKKELK